MHHNRPDAEALGLSENPINVGNTLTLLVNNLECRERSWCSPFLAYSIPQSTETYVFYGHHFWLLDVDELLSTHKILLSCDGHCSTEVEQVFKSLLRTLIQPGQDF